MVNHLRVHNWMDGGLGGGTGGAPVESDLILPFSVSLCFLATICSLPYLSLAWAQGNGISQSWMDLWETVTPPINISSLSVAWLSHFVTGMESQHNWKATATSECVCACLLGGRCRECGVCVCWSEDNTSWIWPFFETSFSPSWCSWIGLEQLASKPQRWSSSHLPSAGSIGVCCLAQHLHSSPHAPRASSLPRKPSQQPSEEWGSTVTAYAKLNPSSGLHKPSGTMLSVPSSPTKERKKQRLLKLKDRGCRGWTCPAAIVCGRHAIW